jgi:hypothetical protein
MLWGSCSLAFYDLLEQRVGSEGLGIFEFNAYEVRGLVGIFMAAIVATDFEFSVQSGRRYKGIGLSEQNLMGEEKILLLVEALVLTKNCPEILS